jgi:hypothetical protein
MMFEEAARQHKRFDKVQEVLKLRDELARDIDRLNGVAITPSLSADAVELWFVRQGNLHPPRRFGFEVQDGRTVSMDRRLREMFAEFEPRALTVRERQEHLALLARWYYSTWREGEFLSFDDFGEKRRRDERIACRAALSRHESTTVVGAPRRSLCLG